MATLQVTSIVDGQTQDVSTYDLRDCPTCPDYGSHEALFEQKRRSHRDNGWTITNQGTRKFRARKVGPRTSRVRERIFELKS